MHDRQRLKLRFGPYRTPKFRYGQKVKDAVGVEHVIVGLRDAKIPWPVGRRGHVRAIILYGDLAKAVRREPTVAIMHWWSVKHATVWRWRRALDVGANPPGTRQLRREHFDQPWGHKARKLAWEKARDPERRAKIAASRRGKPRPPHVVAAMRKANVGRSLPAEQRRKMSEAHRKRGTRPPKAGRPWSAEEDALVRSLAPAEVVKRTGRSLRSVYFRRWELKVPDGRRRGARPLD